MKIVDLQSWPVRWLENRWRARSSNPGPRVRGSWLRSAAAWPSDAWIARRAVRRGRVADRPFVVSVGNLALGGTGKTPVTAALARDLATAGLHGAVLTRGYGSAHRGPLRVDPADDRAGDEARWLAAELGPSGWNVIQARRRRQGLDIVAADGGDPDVVLVEDGHQTAGLGRHLDVLILDHWRVAGEETDPRLAPVTGPVVPWGPWRESVRGARRAGIWLVEADPLPAARGVGGVPVAGFARRFRLAGAAGMDLSSARVGLLSGIARPMAFEVAAGRELARDPVVSVRCADHAVYDTRLRGRIEGIMREAGVETVVTTAKDLTKLRGTWPEAWPLLTLEMDLVWTGERALPELVGERLDAVRRGGAG